MNIAPLGAPPAAPAPTSTKGPRQLTLRSTPELNFFLERVADLAVEDSPTSKADHQAQEKPTIITALVAKMPNPLHRSPEMNLASEYAANLNGHQPKGKGPAPISAPAALNPIPLHSLEQTVHSGSSPSMNGHQPKGKGPAPISAPVAKKPISLHRLDPTSHSTMGLQSKKIPKHKADPTFLPTASGKTQAKVVKCYLNYSSKKSLNSCIN